MADETLLKAAGPKPGLASPNATPSRETVDCRHPLIAVPCHSRRDTGSHPGPTLFPIEKGFENRPTNCSQIAQWQPLRPLRGPNKVPDQVGPLTPLDPGILYIKRAMGGVNKKRE